MIPTGVAVRRAGFAIGAALCVLAGSTPRTLATSTLTARAGEWHVEHDRPTSASVAVEPGRVRLQFALAAGRAASQFAAAVVRPPARLDAFSRLVVRATADRPMRIAVQLRGRDDLGAARWRRTMYVDGRARTTVFELSEFLPVAPAASGAPPLATIVAVMFGVDTVNTRPGTRASITLDDVHFES